MTADFFNDLQTVTVGHRTTGRSHVQAGDDCEDNWDSVTGNDYTVVAVADGLGSADYATVGSEIAATEAVSKAEDYINDLSTESFDSIAEFTESAVCKVLRNVIKHTRKEIAAQAEHDDRSLDAYHTTLTVAIHTPYWYAVCAIGDSGIVGATEDGYQRLVPREDTETDSATVPITSDLQTINERHRLVFEESYLNYLVAFTDGLDRFTWAMNDRTQPRNEFFDRIKSFVDSTDHLLAEGTHDALVEFVESDHFDQHSDDDKTLVISHIPFVESIIADDINCHYKDAEFIKTVSNLDTPTTDKIAGAIECSTRTAARRLEKLSKKDVVNKYGDSKIQWEIENNITISSQSA